MFKIEWLEFANVLASKLDLEDENYYKETFRVFSKNDEGKLRFLDWIYPNWSELILIDMACTGCIPAEEMKFVLSQICSEKVR